MERQYEKGVIETMKNALHSPTKNFSDSPEVVIIGQYFTGKLCSLHRSGVDFYTLTKTNKVQHEKHEHKHTHIYGKVNKFFF